MKNFGLLLLLFFVGTIAVFMLRPLGETNIFFEQTLYIVASVIAAASAFLALRAYGNGPRSRSLLFLAAGLFSWVIADVLFFYLEFYINDLPYPSLADYFFLAGYILMLTGLLIEIRLSDISWKKMNKVVYLASGAFTAVMLGVFSYLTLFSSYSPEALFWENVVTIGYTVGDLLLVLAGFFLLVLVWEYRGGKASRVWIGIFLGFLFTLIGDLFYAITPEELESHVGNIYALSQYFYIGGYVWIAYGLLYLRSVFHSFQQKPSLHKKSESSK